METKTSPKRLLSMLLVLIMALTLLPTAALAAEYEGWDPSREYGADDTIIIGGKSYTYKGDVFTAMLYMIEDTYGGGAKPLTSYLVWKAGNGCILYSYNETDKTAAVTLHNATGSGNIYLPFFRTNGSDGVESPCDTTVTLEGDSTLSGMFYHQTGATTFTGSGSLTAAGSCSFNGAVTVTGGAKVTLGDGTNERFTEIHGRLTVSDGGTLTVTANTELLSGNSTNPTAYPGGITVSGGTLVNNGTIVMTTKTAADPGITGDITGSGAVKFGSSSAPHIKVGGEWVVYGGDISDTGIDLTVTAVETAYKAGSGTVVWSPTMDATVPPP